MKTIKKHGVQNYQTGLIEQEFDTLIKAIELCNKLNGSNTMQPDFRTVFIADGKIYDSEREWINS